MKGHKLGDPEKKKIVLSKYVTFNETSLLKFTISQLIESLKIKYVSQPMEVNTTSPPPVSYISKDFIRCDTRWRLYRWFGC